MTRPKEAVTVTVTVTLTVTVTVTVDPIVTYYCPQGCRKVASVAKMYLDRNLPIYAKKKQSNTYEWKQSGCKEALSGS